MKDKINPDEKKHTKEFRQLIDLLVQEFNPLQVYRFASFRQRESLQGVFAKQQKDHWTYYLLVITDGNGTMGTIIQDYMDANYTDAKVIVLTRPRENLLTGQHYSNGLYASIVHKGKLCHGDADMEVHTALRQPNVRRFLGRAVSHWRNRLGMAKGFLEAGEQALESGHERVCLFLLYQASEQLCKGLIYVFMGYQEQVGNFKRLLYLSACFTKLPLQHFMGTPDNEALLEMMCKSIALDNRENDVLPADKSIYRFLELVESLLQLIEKLCTDRFAELQLEVDRVKGMKTEGEGKM